MSEHSRMSEEGEQGRMSEFDLVVRGGTLAAVDGLREADLGVRDGRIAAIGEGLRGRVAIDARGLLVLPGGVDAHVHLEMPSGDIRTSEDWRSGTRAAAFGGTTTVIDFVEPLAGQPLAEALAARRAEADGRASVDYALHMTLPSAEPGWLAEAAEMVRLGVPSFKLYTTYAGFALDDAGLLEALAAVRAAGGLAMVHAENDAILRHRQAQQHAAGKITPRDWGESRPALAEVEAVERVIRLAEYSGALVYFAHVSTAGAAEAIVRARQRGVGVFGETCPQYLALSDRRYAAEDALEAAAFACAPPLRPTEHAPALWSALRLGDLQCVSTDHCAFNRAGQKARGLEDIARLPSGLPGIEARLALVYSLGVCEGRLSVEEWVDLCCTAPADLFGLREKGRILPGADADLALFDPGLDWTCRAADLHEQVDYTPYEGMRLHGKTRGAILRGVLLAWDDAWTGPVGAGQFVEGRL